MSKLEAAALDGTLFESHRSPSLQRSNSPSPPNTDDEHGSDLSPPASPSRLPPSSTINAHDPQTGPKGVITDRQAHIRHAREEKVRAGRDIRERQERRKIIASTVHEEDMLRAEDEERLLKPSALPRQAGQDDLEDEKYREQWRATRRAEMEGKSKSLDGGGKRGLREIGQEGFLSAVERPGWVVILIYEPGIARCSTLLASTLQLALSDPGITLYRARATSLSFSLLPSQNGGGEDDDDLEERKADPDVLPTLLAYKDGELQQTWIRVDWEIREDGVKGLLQRSGILE